MEVLVNSLTKILKITGLLTLLIQGCYHHQGHGTSPGYNEVGTAGAFFFLYLLAPSEGPGPE